MIKYYNRIKIRMEKGRNGPSLASKEISYTSPPTTTLVLKLGQRSLIS